MESRRVFGPVQIGIVAAALITAFIHIYINVTTSGYLFFLNGLGYIGLVIALFIPQALVNRLLPASLAQPYRKLVRYILIGYTLLTILLWVMMGMREMLAYVDKLAEVVLVVLLWIDRQRS